MEHSRTYAVYLIRATLPVAPSVRTHITWSGARRISTLPGFSAAGFSCSRGIMTEPIFIWILYRRWLEPEATFGSLSELAEWLERWRLPGIAPSDWVAVALRLDKDENGQSRFGHGKACADEWTISSRRTNLLDVPSVYPTMRDLTSGVTKRRMRTLNREIGTLSHQWLFSQCPQPGRQRGVLPLPLSCRIIYRSCDIPEIVGLC